MTKGLPQMVTSELNSLSEAKRKEFFDEYKRRKKSVFMGYLLWLCFGLHYAYTRKWGIQFLFWFTANGLFVWWLVDLFRVPGIISNYNKDNAISVLKDLKVIGASSTKEHSVI